MGERVSSSIKLSPSDKVVRDWILKEYHLESMADAIRLGWTYLAIGEAPKAPKHRISSNTIDRIMSLLADDINHQTEQ